MYVRNEMMLEVDAISSNESLARVAVAAFIAPADPTLEEMSDIKTAVSEAVTNAIIHGYENLSGYEPAGRRNTKLPEADAEERTVAGKVQLRCCLESRRLTIEVEDQGKGIEDIALAMEPLFTTKPQLERSGMGFAFMEAFMDELTVESKPGCGTLVRMKKQLGQAPEGGEA